MSAGRIRKVDNWSSGARAATTGVQLCGEKGGGGGKMMKGLVGEAFLRKNGRTS